MPIAIRVMQWMDLFSATPSPILQHSEGDDELEISSYDLVDSSSTDLTSSTYAGVTHPESILSEIRRRKSTSDSLSLSQSLTALSTAECLSEDSQSLQVISLREHQESVCSLWTPSTSRSTSDIDGNSLDHGIVRDSEHSPHCQEIVLFGPVPSDTNPLRIEAACAVTEKVKSRKNANRRVGKSKKSKSTKKKAKATKSRENAKSKKSAKPMIVRSNYLDSFYRVSFFNGK